MSQKSRLLHGDCREMLKQLPDASIDSIVTDPPYELGFMGKSWDSTGVAYDVTVWQECLRVLKPGGHLLAFGGSRTYHRLAVAIEDAGFQIRDQIMWVYGSGFPKSLNISKAIDKAAGAEREVIGSKLGQAGYSLAQSKGSPVYQGGFGGGGNSNKESEITAPATVEAQQWDGWGTALKPAHEPIVMARKPLEGTVANNVLKHGVGGINIDGCRVGDEIIKTSGGRSVAITGDERVGAALGMYGKSTPLNTEHQGRFPANFIHDGSDEVLALFPQTTGSWGVRTERPNRSPFVSGNENLVSTNQRSESGSAARFFYCAKANKKERNAGLDPDLFPLQNYTDANKMGGAGDTMLTGSGNPRDGRKHNFHPTVKPVALMRYLVRLVTPPNGTVLDPFAGSGTTLVAATMEKFDCIGIEMTDEYLPIIEARVAHATTDTLF